MSQPVIEVDHVWKRFRLHEFKSLYDITANWRRIGREILFPSSQPAAPAEDVFWALRDVQIEIKQGEVVGLIGPNGSGKTTLLRMMSGISRPTKGFIKARGRIGALISVGAGFHPELTARENVFLNGAIMGMSSQDIKRKFDSIIDFAEVEKFLDTPLKHFSSGMAVRLGFSIAAHLEPDILLVDEVLSVGDVRFRQKSFERMKQLFSSGVTIVFVSHSMRQVERLCQRAILLNKGSIVRTGSAADVTNFYLNEYAMQLQQMATPGSIGAFGPVLVDKCAVKAATDNGPMAITFKERSEIEFQLHALEDIHGFKFLVSFVSSEDVVVATLQSHDSPHVSKGRYSLTCRIPEVTLLPGKYRLFARVGADSKIYEQPIGDLKVYLKDTYSKETYNVSYLAHVRSYMSNAGHAYVPHEWDALKLVSELPHDSDRATVP